MLSSFCNLIEVVDGPFLRDSQYLLKTEASHKTFLRRMCRYFASLEAYQASHPERVSNLQYMDLLANPTAPIAAVFKRYGL